MMSEAACQIPDLESDASVPAPPFLFFTYFFFQSRERWAVEVSERMGHTWCHRCHNICWNYEYVEKIDLNTLYNFPVRLCIIKTGRLKPSSLKFMAKWNHARCVQPLTKWIFNHYFIQRTIWFSERFGLLTQPHIPAWLLWDEALPAILHSYICGKKF